MSRSDAGSEPRWLAHLNRLADDSSLSRSWWTWTVAAVVAAALAGAWLGKIGALVVIGVIVAVGTVRVGELVFDGRAGTIRGLAGVSAGSTVAVGLLILAGSLPDTPQPGADLRGKEFSSVTAEDLRGAELSGARLEGLELAERDFSGVIAQGTSFRDSKLSKAVFRGADLRGADFTGACLRGADFSGADLQGITLTGADVEGAVFSAEARLPQAPSGPASPTTSTTIPVPRTSPAPASPSAGAPSQARTCS